MILDYFQICSTLSIGIFIGHLLSYRRYRWRLRMYAEHVRYLNRSLDQIVKKRERHLHDKTPIKRGTIN